MIRTWNWNAPYQLFTFVFLETFFFFITTIFNCARVNFSVASFFFPFALKVSAAHFDFLKQMLKNNRINNSWSSAAWNLMVVHARYFIYFAAKFNLICGYILVDYECIHVYHSTCFRILRVKNINIVVISLFTKMGEKRNYQQFVFLVYYDYLRKEHRVKNIETAWMLKYLMVLQCMLLHNM